MGLYDRLYVNCPECGESVEFQSKAGLCGLIDYNVNDVPAVILAGLNMSYEKCICGHNVTIISQTKGYIR